MTMHHSKYGPSSCEFTFDLLRNDSLVVVTCLFTPECGEYEPETGAFAGSPEHRSVMSYFDVDSEKVTVVCGNDSYDHAALSALALTRAEERRMAQEGQWAYKAEEEREICY